MPSPRAQNASLVRSYYPRCLPVVVADHLAADLDKLLGTRVSGAFQ